MRRMMPDGRTTISYQPNIQPKTTRHSECWRQDWHSHMGIVGDVRRCPHGKVQVLTEVHANARVQGPATDYWRTLHPVLTPVLYRRARVALGAA